MRVVPGNEAAHSRPHSSAGREVHIGVGSSRSTDRTHANLPGARCPGFASPVRRNWPDPAPYTASLVAKSGVLLVCPGVEPDPAVRTEGPRHTCRVEAGDESDALVGAEAGNELGPAFLEILQTEPDARVHIQRAEIS